MEDSKQLTCQIIDNGLFLPWAFCLARYFKNVLYYSNSRGPYTRSKKLVIGDGFEEFERIQNPFDYIKSVDVFVFPDVTDGDLAEYLREQGKLVWGSGHAEELELNRWQSRQMLKRMGLPVNNVEKIVGLENLRAYLKEHDDKIIKMSSKAGSVRGDGETWIHESYWMSELRLDELEHRLGAVKKIAVFTVEDMIDSEVEIGIDEYTVDGKFPDPCGFGFELKDAGYAGTIKPYKELPEQLREANEKLSSKFKSYKYRGWFADEIRIAKDGTPYLIDFTCRSASPAGEPWQEAITNWGDIIVGGAGGEMVNPDVAAPYVCQAMIKSPWGNKDWVPVTYPKKIARWVKLFNACKINGDIHIIPLNEDLNEIGSVVGMGATFEEARDQCKAHAKQIEGYQLEIKTDSLDDAESMIQKAKKFGVKF